MNLTIPGIDFAWGAIHAADVKRAGFKFGISYLSYDKAGKNLSPAELADFWGHGLFTGLVWETSAAAALAGYGAGRRDAHEAGRQADALRPGFPIAFAVDFDVTPLQKPKVRAYFDGVRSVLPKARVGVYAGYHVVKDLVDHGDACGFYWQTYAWSGGLVHPRACVLQYSNGHRIDGAGVDFNHAAPEAFTLFLRGPSTPVPAAKKRAARKLAIWRHHLRELRDVARAIGWSPAMRSYAKHLAHLISG